MLARYYDNRNAWLMEEVRDYLTTSKEMCDYLIENKREYYHDSLPIAVCLSLPSYMKMLFIKTDIEFEDMLKDKDITKMVKEFK